MEFRRLTAADAEALQSFATRAIESIIE